MSRPPRVRGVPARRRKSICKRVTCMTHGEVLRALTENTAAPVVVAARALCLGKRPTTRSTAARSRSVQIGGRYLIPTAHLRRLLGLDANLEAPPEGHKR